MHLKTIQRHICKRCLPQDRPALPQFHCFYRTCESRKLRVANFYSDSDTDSRVQQLLQDDQLYKWAELDEVDWRSRHAHVNARILLYYASMVWRRNGENIHWWAQSDREKRFCPGSRFGVVLWWRAKLHHVFSTAAEFTEQCVCIWIRIEHAIAKLGGDLKRDHSQVLYHLPRLRLQLHHLYEASTFCR